MRALPLSALLLVVASCQNAVDNPCVVAADCGAGQACVDGACIGDERPVPVTPLEGEGDDPKGEGEEGEGDEGEGDGGVEGEGDGGVEGEGDGGVEGEGDGGVEGEGDTVVGEGEGDGPLNLCSGVSCEDFQVCDAGSGDCEYVGEVCDAFQGFGPLSSLQAPTNQTLAVASSSNIYDAFLAPQLAGDHLLDAYALDTSDINAVVNLIAADASPPAYALRIDLTTTANFDTVLSVFDEGSCTPIATNDDLAGDLQHSRVQLDEAETVRANKAVVVTGRDPDARNASHPYTLAVMPRLCGEDVDSLQTFNRCGRSLATTTNVCETNNPCERDANGDLTGRACCISTDFATATTANACGRKTGEPLKTFVSASCN